MSGRIGSAPVRRGGRIRGWLLASALLLVSAGAGRATAAPAQTEEQARRLFESAEVHFRSGLFAEALAEYQAGYEIAPLPGFLINIAQCQRRLGNLSVARATYRKFIMVAPDSPFVPQVKALIAELDALTQELAGTERPAEDTSATGQSEQTADIASPAAGEIAPAAEPRAGEASSAIALVAPPGPAVQPESKTRWWLWGVIGAVAVSTATTLLLVFQSPGTTTLHDGSLGTLRR